MARAVDPSGYLSSEEARHQCLDLPQVSGVRAMAGLRTEPLVLRGIASDWAAVQRWTMAYLADLGGARPVTVIVGNRELGETHLAVTSLDACLRDFDQAPAQRHGAGASLHLKEFDLLRELPALKGDVDHKRLFPRGSIVSTSAWIGPTGAHTGLHYDHLDNLAVLIRGRKRFYLARPGTVESAGGLSAKHDRWAQLAAIGMVSLLPRAEFSGDLFVADLEPGDAIFVPAGWWHEVVNLDTSIFLSGFFGPATKVLPMWCRTQVRQWVHNLFTVGRQPCTCHSSRPPVRPPAPQRPGGISRSKRTPTSG